jgi:hypothetical protein
MPQELHDSPSTGADLKVTLDGQPVALPPQRRSLAGIRAYLETLALQQQRILFSFRVDGARVNLTAMLPTQTRFEKIEAETVDLEQVPLQLIRTAMLQTAEAKTQVNAAITLVLINQAGWAREHWWNLVRALSQPMLTLSLLPENSCRIRASDASLMQLRRWQLEQLGAILQDVDESCWSEQAVVLSNALEHRVLPWLHGLQTSLELCLETLSLTAPKQLSEITETAQQA